MPRDKRSISEFYANQLNRRIRLFVGGNARLEAAWRTVRDWPSEAPSTVLDVGCSIGEMCWRMSVAWPKAHIVGVDLTPEYIDAARKLFGARRLEFVQGDAASLRPGQKFDLVTMIDLYEHIAAGDRPALHAALDGALAPSGAIILTYPTPRHQAWLRETNSEYLQPIDENITMRELERLAADTGTTLVYYRDVNVYYPGDYVHAVVRRPVPWVQCAPGHPRRGFWQDARRFVNHKSRSTASRRTRERLVRDRLGAGWL